MKMLSAPTASTRKGTTSRMTRDEGNPSSAKKPMEAKTAPTTTAMPPSASVTFDST